MLQSPTFDRLGRPSVNMRSIIDLKKNFEKSLFLFWKNIFLIFEKIFLNFWKDFFYFLNSVFYF